MYKLVFGRPDNFKVIHQSNSLEDLFDRRCVSGDLVVDEDLQIVKDPTWLMEWEKKDPECYARRCQRDGWKH